MPLTQTRLLIRADAGPKTGTGHVMRMVALGQAYRARGGEVTFVVHELPNSLIRRLESESFQVIRVAHGNGSQADALDTREIAALIRPDWVALDGYCFQDEYQAWFRGNGARLLVMDDFQHASHQHADLIVNQNAHVQPENYPERLRERLLAGPGFALLRSEFSNSPVPRKAARQAKRILVTFGGADPDNWTLKTLQILADMNRKRLVVDCVVGSCYSHFGELSAFKKVANLNLRVHRNVDRMSSLMQRTDLAITAGGSTCYELARCGVPSIVAPIAENQNAVAKSLSDLGIMITIDSHATPAREREVQLAAAIDRLIDQPDNRETMSRTGLKLIDGRGGFRIVGRLAARLLAIRDASSSDATLLWRWRNDPEVRSVSFQTSPIPLAEHRRWLKRTISNPAERIWIAANRNQEAIGQIRFQIDPTTLKAAISLIVDPPRRGQGLGTALIQAAAERLFETTPVNEIVAQVRFGNPASERALRNAGFLAVEPVVVNGLAAHQFVLTRSGQETIAPVQPLQQIA